MKSKKEGGGTNTWKRKRGIRSRVQRRKRVQRGRRKEDEEEEGREEGSGVGEKG